MFAGRPYVKVHPGNREVEGEENERRQRKFCR